VLLFKIVPYGEKITSTNFFQKILMFRCVTSAPKFGPFSKILRFMQIWQTCKLLKSI